MSAYIPVSLVDVCFSSALLRFGLCEGAAPRKTDVMGDLLFASVDRRWQNIFEIFVGT